MKQVTAKPRTGAPEPGKALVVVHNPTERQYSGLSAAYAHFNRELFSDTLPGALITLQRHKGCYGYYSAKRFGSGDGSRTDEIAMNPQGFVGRTVESVLSTLVHEMVHLWQEHKGKAPKTAYHNKEWAAKMKEVGLQPSTTGKPGGKETGQSCSHYIIEGGRYAVAVASFVRDGFTLYADMQHESAKAKKKAASKTKYTCPACETNAWAKPETNLTCGDCDETMLPEDAED